MYSCCRHTDYGNELQATREQIGRMNTKHRLYLNKLEVN